MSTTNVKAEDLNYDHYTSSKYDRDIINSIPYHAELHDRIKRFVKKNFHKNEECTVLDLGTGTAITAKLIQIELPNAIFDLVDFSKKMLNGAKEKFGKDSKVNYIFGDYSKLRFSRKYDLVISIIGLHHQNNTGKKKLFKKIFSLLKPGGVFLLGDLVTHKNPKKAALNQALHFHHLVEKSADKKALEDWAHHHYVLNDLAPVEDQVQWLKEVGFEVSVDMLKMNTALLVCRRP